MVNPGMPLGQGKPVSSDAVSERGPNHLTGFSIVLADNMDAALKIAQSCPFLEIGAIEVAEAMEKDISPPFRHLVEEGVRRWTG